MVFCVICSLRRIHFQHVSEAGQQHLLISDYARELESLQVFSLNSLVALLAVLAMSGSRIQAVVSALLIYTVSLRLALHTCFLANHPTWSLCLHAAPLLMISCMTCVELFSKESPALAVVVLVPSVLPLVTTIFHHGRYCGDAGTALPVRVRELSAMASPTADVTIVSN